VILATGEHRNRPVTSFLVDMGLAGYDGSIWTHHDGFMWLHLGDTMTVRCGPLSDRTEGKCLVRGGAKSSRHTTPGDQGGATSRRPSGPNSGRHSQLARDDTPEGLLPAVPHVTVFEVSPAA